MTSPVDPPCTCGPQPTDGSRYVTLGCPIHQEEAAAWVVEHLEVGEIDTSHIRATTVYGSPPMEPLPFAPLVAEVERLRALLREVEWLGELGDMVSRGRRVCPKCGGLEPEAGEAPRAVVSPFGHVTDYIGHAPKCRLAAAIEGR